MKTGMVISGGRLETEFALDFVKKNRPDFLIAADKGVRFCYDNQLLPTHIVGDFDSLGEALLPYFEEKGVPIRRFNPVKDATDTEIAVRLCMELGAGKISILGALGGNRLDHLFGNVCTMMIPHEQGVLCELLDAHNRLRILEGDFALKKEEQYGTYVSLIPLSGKVEGVTLHGFKYPLNEYCFSIEESASLGISNEIVEEEGRITFRSGILLLVESRD